ncbi:hypothetical protein N7493_010128 [Penicillium malachiteum]|uniref:Uncharacterized protein n=1 Tax=Penicillium malachiteum TaxID=1324776 RepID=A0AAD6HCJ9_9EURO|nr:hypothetical protein N7493_010128 [Penicillium malachiteum]
MSLSLENYIGELADRPLTDTIHAIAELFPGLQGSVSPKCKYLITHPDYSGQALLNDLGKLFLVCAARCKDEHAPFQTRLLYNSLDEPFEKLYGELYTEAKEGIANGTMVPEPSTEKGCACCRGDPDATILAGFHEGNAFYYPEEEYRGIWGDQSERGSSTYYDDEGKCISHLMASREQVEEALARAEAEAPVASRL